MNVNPRIIEHRTTISERDARIKALEDALELVRGIISDASCTGFNCHDGDWPERLFSSQSVTYKALIGERDAYR